MTTSEHDTDGTRRQAKPRYEAPRVIDLAGIPLAGAVCVDGGSDGVVCQNGGSTGGQCNAGGVAGGLCTVGTSPA